MILGLDCETQGLSGKMIACCIYKSKEVHYILNSKDEIWAKLIELAQKEAKRGKVLYLYAHNMKFDFYKIVNWNLKGLAIKNDTPFIAEYSVKYDKSIRKSKEATIKFLDTWGLYRMSLKSAGKLIGEEKGELSEELKKEDYKKKTKLTKEETEYMIKDAEICYKLVERIKEEMKHYNTNVKTIISIGQIAMNSFLNWCKKNNYTDIFEDKFRNIIIKPKYGKELHKAYRYGRIELKRKEIKKDIYEVDVNNLYSYSAITNPFPELSSERKINHPLETLSVKGFRKLLKQYPIGVSKVVLRTPSSYNKNSYGFLVTRTSNQRYFPNKRNKYLAGSWTNVEVSEALKRGYKLLGCEYIITFRTSKSNPFEEYFKEIYSRRQANNPFANYFWKQIANFTIGKFAQIRPQKEYIMDDIMKVNQYYSKGYKFLKSYGTNYLYYRKSAKKPSKHYNVIISAMTNAYAKIYHYKYLEKIPKEDFVYCDTDNIIFKGAKHLKLFPIGKDIGQWKLSKADTDFKAFNKKTYKIGNDIRASGVRKPKTTEEKKLLLKEFEDGRIHYKRMVGIQKGKNLDDAGTFENIDINLYDSMAEKIAKEDDIENTKLYLDEEETFDMEYVKKCISKDGNKN